MDWAGKKVFYRRRRFLCGQWLEQPEWATRPPNVILFLIADLGWSDLGWQGSDYYRTPEIDTLAAERMRFTDAYAACAVCYPNLAELCGMPAGRSDGTQPQAAFGNSGSFVEAFRL